jgi:putative serine protease PepD
VAAPANPAQPYNPAAAGPSAGQGYAVPQVGAVPVPAVPAQGNSVHPMASAVPMMVAQPPKRSHAKAILAATAITVLLLAVGAQAFWIAQLSGRLSSAEEAIADSQRAASSTSESLAGRVSTLEKASFEPAKIAEAALPSVFRVNAGRATGTAWAIGKPTAANGTSLFTNYHVVEAVWEGSGTKKVTIEHRELLYDARIVAVDKERDVAHLETSASFAGLPISQEPVRPGESVVVVGAPLGLDSSVTTGVVSSASRKLDGSGEEFVQFDAAINPGNSGGPVINAAGQVVGIATAKLRDAEGIGLAIPIKLACQVIPICG